MKANPRENDATVAADILSVEDTPLKTSAELAMIQRRPLDMVAGSLANAAQRSPLDLIESTIRMGATLEQTREVILLARDMEQYDARKQFFRALAKFRAECPPIRKTKSAEIVSERKGTEHGYTWAPLDEIDKTISPVLGANGLSYTFEYVQEGTSVTVICVARHEAGHEQRTPAKLTVGGSPGMSEQQKVRSTMKNGQRYSLEAAFGLSTTDDVPDETGGGEKITDDQAVVLNDLIAETKLPPSRILKYFKVDAISDILAIDYQAAVTLLEEKKK